MRPTAAQPLGRGLVSRPVQAPADLGVGARFEIPRDLIVWDPPTLDIDVPVEGVPMPTQRHFTVPTAP